MPKKQTAATIRLMKAKGEKIAALTAYDYPTARLVDQAGLDVVLVGDSLGMVVQGEADTLSVRLADMIYHCRIVRKAVQSALLVVDMPFGSFQVSPERTVGHAVQLVKQGRAEAVKLEGGAGRLPAIRAILAADIPVMGHIGLTPQSVHALGGYRIQGRTLAGIDRLREDALRLQEAGCFALVLEGIPHPVARLITRALEIPTIGIGSGPDCDGQILVLHDLLGLNPEHTYKFVRVYADGAGVLGEGIRRYAGDVRAGRFPSLAESFDLDQSTLAEMEQKYGPDHQDQ